MKLILYTTSTNKVPFAEWLNTLDKKVRAIISARVDRMRDGNFGDCSVIKEGVWELRIHFGAGYRVYFGKTGSVIIVLLVGGDKGSQNKDIQKALKYWNDYKENPHE